MVVNNPNNWHWVDKNCIDWSRAYFEQKLAGASAEDAGKTVKVSSVSSVEGDVDVSQRKGKVISLFELKIVLGISGFCKSENEGAFSGSITVPELAYDTEADEIQFDTSIYNEDSDSEKMRAVIKAKLLPQLRVLLAKFGSDLIQEHSSDIQLASDKVSSTYTKGNQQPSGAPAPKVVPSPAAPKAQPAAPKPSSLSLVPKYNTSTMHLEPTFNTTAEQLYVTLLDGQRIAAWTRSAPQIEAFPPKEGSSFSLFGGSITGKLIKLVPNERITQLWRLEDWKSGHYAELDIQLMQGAGETQMVVHWLGIPVGEEERVRNNFQDYYVRSIKITFGFGAVL